MAKCGKFFCLGVGLLVGSGVAVPAQAEDWFFLTESDVEVKFFLDRDSIIRKGNSLDVKMFQVYKKPENDGSIAAIVQREYICPDKKSRVKQVIALFEDESIRVYKDISAWEAVKPKTVDEVILKKVCTTP